MSTRVITPPSMDINRDMSQNCPDSSPNPPVVAIPSDGGDVGGAALPEKAGVPITASSLGCPSPAISPNSSGPMMMGPGTELILSTRIRSVPRCLFGPPDPHTAEFAREKVRQLREHDKQRYNFDFDAEEPLEGPFKWEAVPVDSPRKTVSTTSGSNTGSSYAPKAYALSRFPYLSGAVHADRGMVSPPLPRTTINNNQLPPSRQLYFEPDREPLLIARTVEEERRAYYHSTSTATATSVTINRPISSPRMSSSPVTSICQSTRSSSHSHHHLPTVVDPTMLLPSPEASSCSSEDSANVVDMEMELGEDEEDAVTSVGSSSTEDELKISNVLESKSDDTCARVTSGSASAKIIHHHHSSSTSSGLSSRVCSSSSSSSTSSTTSSRRTKSVSSSSSSPSASPSSPSSSQPPITRFLPAVRKRPASTSTTKAASESAPDSSAAGTEKKRAAF